MSSNLAHSEPAQTANLLNEHNAEDLDTAANLGCTPRLHPRAATLPRAYWWCGDEIDNEKPHRGPTREEYQEAVQGEHRPVKLEELVLSGCWYYDLARLKSANQALRKIREDDNFFRRAQQSLLSVWGLKKAPVDGHLLDSKSVQVLADKLRAKQQDDQGHGKQVLHAAGGSVSDNKDEFALALASGGLVNAEKLDQATICDQMATVSKVSVAYIGTVPCYSRDTVFVLPNDVDNPNLGVEVYARGTTGWPALATAAQQASMLLPIAKIGTTPCISPGFNLSAYANQFANVAANLQLKQDLKLAGSSDLIGQTFALALYQKLADTSFQPAPLYQLALSSGTDHKQLGPDETAMAVAVGTQRFSASTDGGQINTTYSDNFAGTWTQPAGTASTALVFACDPSIPEQCRIRRPVTVSVTAIGVGYVRAVWGSITRTSGNDTVVTTTVTGVPTEGAASSRQQTTQTFFPPDSNSVLLYIDCNITANGTATTNSYSISIPRNYPTYSDRSVILYVNDTSGQFTVTANRTFNVVFTGAQQVVGASPSLQSKAHWRDEVMSALQTIMGPSLSMVGTNAELSAVLNKAAAEDGINTLGVLKASGFLDTVKGAMTGLGKLAKPLLKAGVTALADHLAAAGVVPTPLAAAGVVASPVAAGTLSASGRVTLSSCEDDDDEEEDRVCAKCRGTGHPFVAGTFVDEHCVACDGRTRTDPTHALKQLTVQSATHAQRAHQLGQMHVLKASGRPRTSLLKPQTTIPRNTAQLVKYDCALPAWPTDFPATCLMDQTRLSKGQPHHSSGRGQHQPVVKRPATNTEDDDAPDPVLAQLLAIAEGRGGGPSAASTFVPEDVLSSEHTDMDVEPPTSAEQGVAEEIAEKAAENGISFQVPKTVITETDLATYRPFMQTEVLPNAWMTGLTQLVGGNFLPGIASMRQGKTELKLGSAAMFPTVRETDGKYDVVVLTLTVLPHAIAGRTYKKTTVSGLTFNFSSEFSDEAIKMCAELMKFLSKTYKKQGKGYYITTDAPDQTIEGSSFQLALAAAACGVPNCAVYTGGVDASGNIVAIDMIDVKLGGLSEALQAGKIAGPFVFPRQNANAVQGLLTTDPEKLMLAQFMAGTYDALPGATITCFPTVPTMLFTLPHALVARFSQFVQVPDHARLYAYNSAYYQKYQVASRLRTMVVTKLIVAKKLAQPDKPLTPHQAKVYAEQLQAMAKTQDEIKPILNKDVVGTLMEQDKRNRALRAFKTFAGQARANYSKKMSLPGYADADSMLKALQLGKTSFKGPATTLAWADGDNIIVQVRNLPSAEEWIKPAEKEKKGLSQDAITEALNNLFG